MQKDSLNALGGLLSPKFLLSLSKRQGSLVSKNVQTNFGDFDYQIYLPPGIERKKNLPVIVFLHGIRERGSGGYIPMTGTAGNFLKQYLKQVPAIILLPQCRPGKYWSDPAMDEMVVRMLDQTVEEFQADPKRLHLTGVSMGGYGVWHFASAHPGEFASLVSICGGSSIMKGERFMPIAEKVGKTPAWIFHGAQDSVVPVTESRQMVKALETCGGNFKYSEYENAGHNVWLNALGEKNLLSWMLAQRLE